MEATRPSCGSSSACTKPCRRTSGTSRTSRGGSPRASSSCDARDALPRRGPSQLRAYVPQLGVETLAEGRAQILRAAAAAGAGFPADLALDHQHVARAPVRERFVVIEQGFTEVEQVAMPFAIPEDLEQGRRSPPLAEVVKGVVERGAVDPPPHPSRLLGGRLQAGEIFGFLQAGQELDLAELHRLEAAGPRKLRAKGEESLRRHRLQDIDLLDEKLFDDVDALQVMKRKEHVVGIDSVARGRQLEEHDLEPQLVDLVGDDEKQLVMLGAQPVLKLEELRHLEVCAVGELAALFPEPSAH